jgi:hypothetical protein
LAENNSYCRPMRCGGPTEARKLDDRDQALFEEV